MRCDAAPTGRRTEKKKNVFRSTSRRNTLEKTDGRRRPMPQQIWKGPEIKITDARPRRLTSAAAAHDAWETARPYLYATTNLLAASPSLRPDAMACFHIQRLLPEVRARRASHNCSAAIGDGGEKSRSDFRDGVRCAWAKPSEDAITTNNALIGSGSPETFPAPCARATASSSRASAGAPS